MKLQELMVRKALSFDDLSEASGVAVSTIAGIVYGRTKLPHPKTMRAIAKILNVEVDQIDEFSDAINNRLGDNPSKKVRAVRGVETDTARMPELDALAILV